MTAADSPTKITVQIWEPLLVKFQKKMLDACLRRDAYLAMVLANELEFLDSEVSIPNSRRAHDYIAKELAAMTRRVMSLSLPLGIVTTLDKICRQKRIVRDAFFNRLFLLLTAQPKTIDRLWFSSITDENWRAEVWREFKHDGPFFERGFYPLEPAVDPFWAIRAGLQVFNEDAVRTEDYLEPATQKAVRVQRGISGVPEPLTGIYTVYFHQKVTDPKRGEVPLTGFNCYVHDSVIPGTEAQRAQQAALDELMESLQ